MNVELSVKGMSASGDNTKLILQSFVEQCQVPHLHYVMVKHWSVFTVARVDILPSKRGKLDQIHQVGLLQRQFGLINMSPTRSMNIDNNSTTPVGNIHVMHNNPVGNMHAMHNSPMSVDRGHTFGSHTTAAFGSQTAVRSPVFHRTAGTPQDIVAQQQQERFRELKTYEEHLSSKKKP